MANCIDCRYSYVEDIWNEWDCIKSGNINIDDEGFLEDKEFECKDYKDDRLLVNIK